jgi:hypothetical protein
MLGIYAVCEVANYNARRAEHEVHDRFYADAGAGKIEQFTLPGTA